MVGTILGVAGNMAMAGINNAIARGNTDYDRRENYRYSQMAAHEADERTRALYNDLYSPQALIDQYKEAGLSPSQMAGGMPGGGGQSSAQGTGAAGPATPFMPISLLEGAQIANIKAQTEKTKAETNNIEKDTDLKILQEEWQTAINSEKLTEWRIFGSYDENGISLYDEANKHKSFEQFKKWYEDNYGGQTNEYERRALQKIYTASYYLDREISTLTNEKVSAKFLSNITEEMQKLDFEKLNAESTIQYLKQNIQTNKLEGQQKKAWNDLLERLGRRSETGKDVLLIMGMLIDKALTQYKLPTIETGGKTININKGDK